MKKLIFVVTTFLFVNNAYALTLEEQLINLKNDYVKLEDQMNNIETTRLDKTYPIGSIYETTTYSSAEEVNNSLGGKWERYGNGKTLVGVDENDSDFNVAGISNKGSKTTSLTINNLPSHTHSIPALSGTAASAGAHTHTRGTMNITGSFNIRATNGDHVTIINKYGAFSSSIISWSGTHDELQRVPSTTAYYNTVTLNAANNWTGATSSNGAHTHSVTTVANTSGSSGSGTAFTNLQPYITVYMYKRIA